MRTIGWNIHVVFLFYAQQDVPSVLSVPDNYIHGKSFDLCSHLSAAVYFAIYFA